MYFRAAHLKPKHEKNTGQVLCVLYSALVPCSFSFLCALSMTGMVCFSRNCQNTRCVLQIRYLPCRPPKRRRYVAEKSRPQARTPHITMRGRVLQKTFSGSQCDGKAVALAGTLSYVSLYVITNKANKKDGVLRSSRYLGQKSCETSCRDSLSSQAQSLAVSALTRASSLSIRASLSYLIACAPQQVCSCERLLFLFYSLHLCCAAIVR